MQSQHMRGFPQRVVEIEKGEQMGVIKKKCKDCGKMKHMDEFYARSGKSHLRQTYCIDCFKKRSANQEQAPRHISTVESERLLIEHLTTFGIPALPGKALAHAYADVIAWGCVLLEVKASKLIGNAFHFGFTPAQQIYGLRGHLLVLACDHGDKWTFHCFDAKDARFYRPNGTLKSGITYTPDRSNAGRPPVFTDDGMEYAEDKWELIEDERQRVRLTLLRGDPLPVMATAAERISI